MPQRAQLVLERTRQGSSRGGPPYVEGNDVLRSEKPRERDPERPFSNQEARDLAFRLKEDRKALHKRVINLKETLEHKVKVEVGEGTLRQRRQPGKQWSKDEIGGGEGSS